MLEGWSLYRLGRIAEADDAFHQALRQSSNAWDARSGLGYCALNKNRLVEAEEEFSESLRQNPNDPEALIGLGIVRHREGRDTDAVNYLKKGLASGPPNPEAEDILRKVVSRQSVSRPPAGAGRDTSGPANHLKAGARTEQQAGP
jgi:Flp pilus assembly protein TadD